MLPSLVSARQKTIHYGRTASLNNGIIYYYMDKGENSGNTHMKVSFPSKKTRKTHKNQSTRNNIDFKSWPAL